MFKGRAGGVIVVTIVSGLMILFARPAGAASANARALRGVYAFAVSGCGEAFGTGGCEPSSATTWTVENGLFDLEPTSNSGGNVSGNIYANENGNVCYGSVSGSFNLGYDGQGTMSLSFISATPTNCPNAALDYNFVLVYPSLIEIFQSAPAAPLSGTLRRQRSSDPF